MGFSNNYSTYVTVLLTFEVDLRAKNYVQYSLNTEEILL